MSAPACDRRGSTVCSACGAPCVPTLDGILQPHPTPAGAAQCEGAPVPLVDGDDPPEHLQALAKPFQKRDTYVIAGVSYTYDGEAQTAWVATLAWGPRATAHDPSTMAAEVGQGDTARDAIIALRGALAPRFRR